MLAGIAMNAKEARLLHTCLAREPRRCWYELKARNVRQHKLCYSGRSVPSADSPSALLEQAALQQFVVLIWHQVWCVSLLNYRLPSTDMPSIESSLGNLKGREYFYI